MVIFYLYLPSYNIIQDNENFVVKINKNKREFDIIINK